MRVAAVIVLAGALVSPAIADGRYQAVPLTHAESGKGGTRALILDTQDGHAWIWSDNELVVAPDGQRKYGAGFVYQGKLRPGTQPGERLEPQAR